MENPNIKIRQATENDCDEIGKLYYDTVRTINSRDYSKREIDVWSELGKKPEVWEKKISEQYFLVAVFDGKIVGISSIEKNGYLDFMYVHKDYQRSGIAQKLLIEIEKKAAEQSNEEIWAYVSLTANAFFEKNGYEFSGEKIISVQGIDFVDRIMKKKLNV